MHEIASFHIHSIQYLNSQGEVTEPLPNFAQDPENLRRLYRGMVITRQFDKKAIAMQRTGQLGTYASCLGQEAIGIGIGYAMRKDDVLLPFYRDIAAQFTRGVRMTDILLYWGGDERGMDYAEVRQDFPISIPVASQCCHAVGVAYAIRYRKESRVAVCTLGDGGTSKGDFYESLNAAGVWQLPVVFVVNNNQWAISVPRRRQCQAETLAQKAIAAGIEGLQVDGNDVIAVQQVVQDALEKARSGAGPTLIEAMSYRMSDHTTADDASRYRSAEELQRYGQDDPLIRLQRYLRQIGHWTEEYEVAMNDEANTKVDQAVREYLKMTPQPPESMFDYLYASLPATLNDQRAAVSQVIEEEDAHARAYAH